MSEAYATIQWRPISEVPELRTRVVVHAMNNYYAVGVWSSDRQRFIDKDGQPIVAGIEWAYLEDRDE